MVTVVRQDGSQFVVQAYRERVVAPKKTILQHKLQTLSKQYGQHIRLFQVDKETFEVVISRDTGYLLAETVVEYFNRPKNLIYCEQLTNSQQAILIVVRNGAILLDTRIELTKVAGELLPFIADSQQYDVVISGAVPITDDEQDASKLFIPADSLGKFEVLSESLYKRLPLLAKFHLQTLVLALKGAKFKTSPVAWALAGFIALIIIGVVAWWMAPSSPSQPRQQRDVYASYRQALTTPSPVSVLKDVRQTLQDLYFAPEWHLQTVTYQQGRYSSTFEREGNSSLSTLNRWADQKGYRFAMSNGRATITLSHTLIDRQEPAHVYDLQQVVNLLIDQMGSLVGSDAISLGSKQVHGKLSEQQLAITFSDASPDVLPLIGKQLDQFPVAVNRVEIRLNDGLISGRIIISVWGT